MISHYLVHGWQVRWVELFCCARVGAVGEAARSDKEGATGDGAPDGAALVNGHGGESFHNVAVTHWPAISGSNWHCGAVHSGLKRILHFCSNGW